MRLQSKKEGDSCSSRSFKYINRICPLLMVAGIFLIHRNLAIERHEIEQAESTRSIYQSSSVCVSHRNSPLNGGQKTINDADNDDQNGTTIFDPIDNEEEREVSKKDDKGEKQKHSEEEGQGPITVPCRTEDCLKEVEVIHCGNCGKCSTLSDIGLMYRTKKTLTADATVCAYQYLIFGETMGKRCLEKIGFTYKCADCWLKNIQCTTQKCRFTCLKHTLYDIFFHNKKTNDDKMKQLNLCLECDERMCGSEFLSCAGANRRMLGIVSDIERTNEEQCNLVKEGYYGEGEDDTSL